MSSDNGHAHPAPDALRPRTVPQEQKPVSIIPYQGADYYEAKSPEFVQQLIPAGVERVLDVGCGAGTLGRILKADGVREVVGIERCETAAAEARRVLDRVHVGDVEAAAVDYPDGYFDCIVYSGVLEHMLDPWFVLYDHRRLLKADGHVVVLVPNVQHYSVMLDLLRGNWRYTDAGLLDATHYRFFTRREAVRMFQETGYALEQLTGYTLGDLPADAARLAETLRGGGQASAEFLEDLGVYVWVGRAQKIAAWQPKSRTTAAPASRMPEPVVCLFDDADEPPAPAPATPPPMPQAATPEAPTVSIIIPAWNQLDYTRMCIASLRNHTPETYEIIVVDNGSTDGTPAWLADQADVRTIRNEENAGFAVACNQGLAAARGAHLVLLNNDTAVTPGWSTRLIAAAEHHDRVGLVGPVSNRVGGRQMDPHANYDDIPGLLRYAAATAAECGGEVEDLPWLSGFCWLMPRETYDAIGPLDERFGIGTFEDNDYCMRVAISGRRLLVARDTFIHHQCSVTFTAAGIDYQEQMAKNNVVFTEKWADHPLRRGLDAYAAEDWPAALAHFESAAAAAPEFADAHRNAARTYMRMHRWAAAAAALAQACELRPCDWLSRIELAKLYRRLGRLSEAATAVEPMLNHQHMTRAHRAAALVIAGEFAMCAADWDTAEHAFRTAVTAQEEFAGAWNGLGLIAGHSGQTEEARASFQRAATLDKASPDPWSNLGVLEWQAGNTDTALSRFSAALDRDPAHADALDNFVAAALAEGRPDAARERVEAALALEPECAVAQALLTQCVSN